MIERGTLAFFLRAVLISCLFGPSCEGQSGKDSVGESQTTSLIGQPLATTVQLPTFGVAIDAEGLLKVRAFDDPTGKLRAQQLRVAVNAVAGEAGVANAQRKVSLTRLEAAIDRCRAEGKEPDERMLHLAGLTRVTSAFCFPQENEIVICGPAEPWVEDFAGVARGIRSGVPILRLDDLLVALRAYRGNGPPNGFVGCSIGPSRDGLARFKAYQRSIPRTVRPQERIRVANTVASDSRDQLGPARVTVFGVPPNTHFAHVMIEADYRMKRMAIGVEPTPVPIVTFADALKNASHGRLERWWLTPMYDGVWKTPDAMAMRIVGQGVQLQTQIKQISDSGAILDHAGKPTRAAQAYATSFTKQYRDLASASIVFAQLRQQCDLLILSAFMRQHDWYGVNGWDCKTFGDESIYPVETQPQIIEADTVVNSFWKGSRMFVPVGGGVSIQISEALRLAKTLDDNDPVSRSNVAPPTDDESWWWD